MMEREPGELAEGGRQENKEFLYLGPPRGL
jgi:hypothetical protein